MLSLGERKITGRRIKVVVLLKEMGGLGDLETGGLGEQQITP
jgi:hypothetical protein